MRSYFIAALLGTGLVAGTANYKHRMIVSDASAPTCSYAASDGEICTEGDIEVQGDLYVADDATFSDDVAITGDLTAAAAVIPTMAATLYQIRFCGNGPNNGTEVFLSPVDNQFLANYEFGGSGCDGEDNTTIATADEVYHAGFAMYPVALACVGVCTGASAANDAIVFRLMDDTAAVSGMTCTCTLTGDATPCQCTTEDATPATVAAGSAIAIGIDNTNDVCSDAGDDFECILSVTF